MSKFEPDESPLENIKANIEVSNKLANSVRPIVEQQERLNEMTKPLKEVSEQYKDIVSQITLKFLRQLYSQRWLQSNVRIIESKKLPDYISVIGEYHLDIKSYFNVIPIIHTAFG